MLRILIAHQEDHETTVAALQPWQLLLLILAVPKITRFRYFGTNTTWYLQYHLIWERLCHSLMTVSFLVNGHVHVMETVSHCTPQRQSLSESRRQRRRLTH
jgi:hypothetical protein